AERSCSTCLLAASDRGASSAGWAGRARSLPVRPRAVVVSLILLLGASRALAATEPSIPYQEFTLPNGLRVFLSEDHRAPQVTVNIWYHVGAANERHGRSGFAPLLEHLMFSD